LGAYWGLILLKSSSPLWHKDVVKSKYHKTTQGINPMQNSKNTRRPKGLGSVYLRGNTWYAQWWSRGRRYRVCTKVVGDSKKAKEKAELKLKSLLEPYLLQNEADTMAVLVQRFQSVEDRIKKSIEETKHHMTLKEIENAFRKSPRRHDCSVDMLNAYCAIVRRFVRFAGGDTPIAKIGDREAGIYAKSISASTASSYNKVLNGLTLVWKTIGRDAGLPEDENPWKHIARKRNDSHTRRAFTKEETDAIIQVAEGEMKILIGVCLYTGLRLGDACTLQWNDIREDAVYVLTSKRGKKVAIPLHPRLKELLGTRKENGFVMPEIARRYKSRHGIIVTCRNVKQVIEQAGIKTTIKDARGRMRPDATAHSFRHTFVTRAIEAGIPQHYVQAIVGHSSAKMTEHYTHLSDEAVLSAFKKIV
jgi:integrase